MKSRNKTIHLLAGKTFVVIFVAYMLDVFYARLNSMGFGLVLAPIVLLLKLLVYGGFFSTCVEALVDARYKVTFKGYLRNCKDYCWTYVLLLLVVIIIDFIFNAFFENMFSWSFVHTKNHFQILIYPVIAQLIIFVKKYEINKNKSKHFEGIGGFCIIIVLYFLDLGCFYLPYHFDVGNIEITRVTHFLSKIFQLYMFLYFASFVAFPYEKEYPEAPDKKEIYLITTKTRGLLGLFQNIFFPQSPWLHVVLKALTPKEYSFREFIDEDLEEEAYQPGKLVAISSFSMNVAEAYYIAKKFRAKGSKVIMGGPHAGFIPEEALCFCDSVVVGEVEGIWDKVLADYENDCLEKIYYGEPLEDFYRKTDEAVLGLKEKFAVIQLETTRGCKFNCDFCVIPGLTYRTIRHRPIENVIKIIKHLKKKRSTLLFLDNNIFADRKYSVAFLTELSKLNVSWTSSSSIDVAKDDEMLDLLKRSGCTQLLIGYEIFSTSKEKEKKGKYSLSDQYLELSKKILNKGIAIKAQFIFGFEKDNYVSLLDLWKFCFKLRPSITSVGILTPLPGTKLYSKMIEQDRIINLNWSNYSLSQFVFHHDNFNGKFLSKTFFAQVMFYFFTTSVYGQLCSILLILALFFEQAGK